MFSNGSCNFLLVSLTYMALQFEHFIAYTTPFDWQLSFFLRGTSVFLVDKILFVSVINIPEQRILTRASSRRRCVQGRVCDSQWTL